LTEAADAPTPLAKQLYFQVLPQVPLVSRFSQAIHQHPLSTIRCKVTKNVFPHNIVLILSGFFHPLLLRILAYALVRPFQHFNLYAKISLIPSSIRLITNLAKHLFLLKF
jgi:hypothetical protein